MEGRGVRERLTKDPCSSLFMNILKRKFTSRKVYINISQKTRTSIIASILVPIPICASFMLVSTNTAIARPYFGPVRVACLKHHCMIIFVTLIAMLKHYQTMLVLVRL